MNTEMWKKGKIACLVSPGIITKSPKQNLIIRPHINVATCRLQFPCLDRNPRIQPEDRNRPDFSALLRSLFWCNIT